MKNKSDLEECNCVLPEQSCPTCRAAARKASGFDEEAGTLPADVAAYTVKHYCCAVCYGHLIERIVDHSTSTVECARYGYEHSGYVTKSYTDRRKSDSYAEALEVRQAMKAWGMLPNSQREPKEILSELGF